MGLGSPLISGLTYFFTSNGEEWEDIAFVVFFPSAKRISVHINDLNYIAATLELVVSLKVA